MLFEGYQPPNKPSALDAALAGFEANFQPKPSFKETIAGKVVEVFRQEDTSKLNIYIDNRSFEVTKNPNGISVVELTGGFDRDFEPIPYEIIHTALQGLPFDF